MISMRGSFYNRLTVGLLAAGFLVGIVSVNAQESNKRGRKYKAPPPMTRVEITILRDSNGKPIENAAVIFHPMEGEKNKGNMELKTNEDGKTVIDVLTLGDKVRLQIIAKGFQTYGQDYKLDKPEMAIEVRMKRPGEQYSITRNPQTTQSPRTIRTSRATIPSRRTSRPMTRSPRTSLPLRRPGKLRQGADPDLDSR
jgi:5-hydroxyisourate hydrolase-like protein (transthyretin family)